MSWITFVWALVIGACVVMALPHLLLALKGEARANLFFVLAALSVGGIACGELSIMHSRSTEEIGRAIQWTHVPVAFLVLGIVGFVLSYFRTGRLWLGIAACSVRFVSLLINFALPPNLNFRAITALRPNRFLGDTIALPEGYHSPWMRLGELSSLLLLAFVIDASLALWRRGRAEDRRRAAVVGGSITLFILLAAGLSALIHADVIQLPYLISFPFLGVIVAMGFELSYDILRAAQTARELRVSEAALRESDMRMSLAVSAAKLGVWVWNIQRNDVWITPEGRRLFGFSESESLNLERFLNAIHEEDRPRVEAQIRASFAEGGEYEREYRVVLPGGQVRWIAGIGRLELDPQGLPALMRGVTWDITERRVAELEKQRLQHEIAHVGRVSMMGQLASALAHEINQPLGAILRNAEAAELFMKSETPDLDEVRAILADIRRDDQRAGNIIDGMRAMLKRHVLDTQLLDMAELVRNVTGIARSDAATRQVKLNVNLPANLPQVRGDRVHLQQVLLNLILNGMDALKGESPPNRRVTVSARVDDTRTMEIAVSDTGRGIAAEQLARVFDPFFTTKLDGMGMGLPISRTIIEAHGGRLWAENNNGSGGATFRFTLPFALEGAPS